jgi:hypothetical protein
VAKYWVSDETAGADASFDSVPDGLVCLTPWKLWQIYEGIGELAVFVVAT